MTITEADWAELESAPGNQGVSRRLVHPACSHKLFLTVQHPGRQRLLTLLIDDRTAEKAVRTVGRVPRTKGLELGFVTAGQATSELQVLLTADALRDVFNPLAADVTDAVMKAPDELGAVLALIDRFEHWRQLLAGIGDTGLPPEWRRGLVGELHVFAAHILPLAPAAEAVASWTGPTGAPQDFQLPGGAIEVKASAAKKPQTIVISNERELDATGAGTLLLMHVSMDERRGGEGRGLNTMIDDLRAALGTSPARVAFDDLLVRAGYLAHHRDLYEEPRYTVRELRLWQVSGDFPRITETDLRPGVGDCRYRIETGGLGPYVTDLDTVRRVVQGDR